MREQTFSQDTAFGFINDNKAAEFDRGSRIGAMSKEKGKTEIDYNHEKYRKELEPSRASKGGLFASITTTFLEHGNFLKKFLARYLSVEQDIEDVAQEAYLRAYVAEQKKAIDQPKAFLFRVAKNLALTKLTQKSTQITSYLEDAGVSVVIETAAGIDDELEAQQCLGLYCEAVAALPEKCRQVFLLRKVHGLTHKDIAERMALSVSSVEKYLRQGVRACDEYLCKHEGSMQHAESRQIQRGKG